MRYYVNESHKKRGIEVALLRLYRRQHRILSDAHVNVAALRFPRIFSRYVVYNW